MGSTLVRRNLFRLTCVCIHFTAAARWYSKVHLNERLRLNTKIWWGFGLWGEFCFGKGFVHIWGGVVKILVFTRKLRRCHFLCSRPEHLFKVKKADKCDLSASINHIPPLSVICLLLCKMAPAAAAHPQATTSMEHALQAHTGAAPLLLSHQPVPQGKPLEGFREGCSLLCWPQGRRVHTDTQSAE